ncbi:hypothetical protein B9W62_18410 [Streptomyces sp. CS113]|uniref:hypothetical protein n=1 Tax=Streptomyces sp. CS113 TaxID=1982761 RepID=UPI000B419068|nr:hypothetical protein [Streptomyces sp. CS113]OWA08246.1 hypothetical protein B9W62_18410 [Streptomyces sp. CS113]
MNPQSWLDAFVGRNEVDLARMRGYLEDSLAAAAVLERKKRPHPRRVEGAVISMDVRDRVLLAAATPVFESGNFQLRPGPNRSVGLEERASGVLLRMRKIKELPVARLSGETVVQVPYQAGFDELDEPGLDALPTLRHGYVPALVWWMDKSDLLGGFLVVVLDDEKSLNRSPLVACAKAEVPALATLPRGNVKPSVQHVKDDFDNLVAPRRPRREAGGAEGAQPSV